MNKRLLVGVRRHMLPVPPLVWKREVAHNAEHSRAALAFMTEAHHRVRDLAVLELPRQGGPLAPEFFAGRLELSVERVTAILDELEKHLTFLFRNPQGQVTWAYPVTVEPTPHHVTFSTGEQVYAA